MPGRPDDRFRYLVHFADGGAGMRHYDQPLHEAGTLTDGDVDYILTRVDQPRSPESLGHAWAQPPETHATAVTPGRPSHRLQP